MFLQILRRDRNNRNIKNEFLNNFSLGVNLSLEAGKYVIKINFDIKIEIGIFNPKMPVVF